MNTYHIQLNQYSCTVDFNESTSRYQVYGFTANRVYGFAVESKDFKGLSTALFYASQVLARLVEESEKVNKL
jgi:hypothetical protein